MKRIQTISLIFSVLFLSACATGGSRSLDGSEIKDVLASFKSGELRLECRLACSGAWGAALKDAKSLYDNQRWTDLAMRTGTIGFEEDLSYYYLGRSAEGLGYIDAAKTYYYLAIANRFKCNFVINQCSGIDILNNSRIALERLNSTGSITIAASAPAEGNSAIGSKNYSPPPSSISDASAKSDVDRKASDSNQGKNKKEPSIGETAKRKEAERLAEEARLRKEREDIARKEEAKRQLAERQAEEARQRQEREEARRREEAMRQESIRQAEEARKEAKRQEENNEKLARNSIRKANSQERSQIIKAVNKSLFDEESSRYREINLIPNSFACAEVNGKNRFGGYTGYQDMVVAFIDGNWIPIQSLRDKPIDCLDLISKLNAKK